MAVNQAVQNTAARGLADSRRNCGDGNLNITFFINIFIIDELFTLLSKIYGLILAREVVQACDRVPFPWHRRYGIRRIV
jgi:hypothetical protein